MTHKVSGTHLNPVSAHAHPKSAVPLAARWSSSSPSRERKPRIFILGLCGLSHNFQISRWLLDCWGSGRESGVHCLSLEVTFTCVHSPLCRDSHMTFSICKEGCKVLSSMCPGRRTCRRSWTLRTPITHLMHLRYPWNVQVEISYGHLDTWIWNCESQTWLHKDHLKETVKIHIPGSCSQRFYFGGSGVKLWNLHFKPLQRS